MMKKEIELKFLVRPEALGDIVKAATIRMHITQGYLFGNSHIRVRNIISTKRKHSVLTIKSDRDGVERDEFEYNIPYEEGLVLLSQFATAIISKTRYIVENDKNKWEIDDFHGKNHGLILAEIEIPQLDYNVSIPYWLSSDQPVSEDDRYYNYNLAINPYSEWEKEKDEKNE